MRPIAVLTRPYGSTSYLTATHEFEKNAAEKHSFILYSATGLEFGLCKVCASV